MRLKNLRFSLRTPAAAGLFAGATLAAAILACSEVTAGNGSSDSFPPTITMVGGTNTVDTVLSFTANVTDNLGIKRIHIAATGGVTDTLDTAFTSAVTQISIPVRLSVPVSVPQGTAVTIIGYAIDGAGNRSKPDTLKLAVGNVSQGTAVITSPASGTAVVQGKSVILSMSAVSPVKVVGLGYQTTGSFAAAESTLYTSPLRDSVARMDTLAIPAAAATGSLIVTPFVLDSLGQRTLGTPITLVVQTASSTTAPPVVNFGLSSRIEVTDTLHVEATDPVGLSYLGYEIRLAPSTALATPPRPTLADSIASNGTVISVPHTFTLALPSSIFTKFPDTIYVRAFARDANVNSIRGYAKLASGAIREDTIVVVAGVTRTLPNGGSVADALYHQGHDQLYLTNIDRNAVEVFNLPDSSFKTAISVGSRPWGITAWPRDRLGTMGDTLLVANSGGTDISYVDLTTMHEVSVIQQQQFPGVVNNWPRYQLPNIVVSTVTTELSPTTNLPIPVRHTYDFSDRPQFVAAVCRPGVGTACGDVILTYSTTPTKGQTPPFDNLNGSVRWENLSVRTTNSAVPDSIKSHFFFEQIVNVYPQNDTLAVTRYDAVLPSSDPGYAIDILPPFQQLPPRFAGDTSKRFYSVVVNIATLGLRDTTYARNSGNFKRAVFGEGGPLLGSRSMIYTDTTGSVEFLRFTAAGDSIPFPGVDLGVSNYFTISDFIGNTFQRVAGVAMNFDGSLAAIRGDSTYMINPNLRLLGLLPTSASNSGIDFHPKNTLSGFGGTAGSGLMFAASADANLEVYETCHYQRVALVPIRDPIIGPIKAALRSNGKLIIFGVTAKGVVIVTLPNTFNASCP